MSRTVIGHSRIFPRRIGNAASGCSTAVAQFHSPFYGCVVLSSLHLSLYFYAVRQRALGNEYLRPTSPRPGVPVRENLRVPNSRRSCRRNSLRIKLQIYSTAAPCLRVHLAFLMNEIWRTYSTGDLVHVSRTRREFRTSFEETGIESIPPDLESRSQVFGATPEVDGAGVHRRRGFQRQNWIGEFVRTRLEPTAGARLFDC